MAADGARWGGVGEAWRGAAEGEPSGPMISPSESEGWRGAAEGEPSGPMISPSESEERRALPPTLNYVPETAHG